MNASASSTYKYAIYWHNFNSRPVHELLALNLRSTLRVLEPMRLLTEVQEWELAASIAVALERSSTAFNVVFIHSWLDGEAESYAQQIASVFKRFSLSGPPIAIERLPPSLEGVAISVDDPEHPSPNALRMSEILTNAQIPHRFVVMRSYLPNKAEQDRVEIVVGRCETLQ
jgi:hypothetical protein